MRFQKARMIAPSIRATIVAPMPVLVEMKIVKPGGHEIGGDLYAERSLHDAKLYAGGGRLRGREPAAILFVSVSKRGETMHLLFGLLLIPFGAVHFLPTIIAAMRNSRHLLTIFLINLCFGWTAVGWVIALVWAITSEPKWVYAYAPPAYRRY